MKIASLCNMLSLSSPLASEKQPKGSTTDKEEIHRYLDGKLTKVSKDKDKRRAKQGQHMKNYKSSRDSLSLSNLPTLEKQPKGSTTDKEEIHRYLDGKLTKVSKNKP